MDPTLLVITIYKPAQLFRIVMADARSHEFFARVVNRWAPHSAR
jgi:hypothetical protein